MVSNIKKGSDLKKELCGAKTSSGGFCKMRAGWSTFHKGSGACYHHHKLSIHKSEKLKSGSCMPKSMYEERALLDLRDAPNVIEYTYEPFPIPYPSPFEHGPRNLKYTPDILVHYADKKRVIIEVKVRTAICDSQNLAKFKAADEYANCNDCAFEVWVYDSIDKSISSYRDIVDECKFSDYYTWFALSQWVKNEMRINTYWEKFALGIGHELKNGSGITDKQPKMKQCWIQAVKHGFIP